MILSGQFVPVGSIGPNTNFENFFSVLDTPLTSSHNIKLAPYRLKIECFIQLFFNFLVLGATSSLWEVLTTSECFQSSQSSSCATLVTSL